MPLLVKSIGLCTAMAWLFVCGIASLPAGEEVPTNADAKTVDGLRLRLQHAAAGKAAKSPPRFEVVFDNVGESDLNVKLGYSLANGKSHHPDALRLLAVSKGNKTRTLIHRNGRVAGRLDPLVVPLPAGSSYTLRFALDQFADSETGEPLDLAVKDYRITAEFVGEAVTKTNEDVQGLALMPYWQGTVRSNEIQFPLAKTQAAK